MGLWNFTVWLLLADVGRVYEYNFVIGAVRDGQSIRIGAWEDDPDAGTGWLDDALGDKWVMPDDFMAGDGVFLLDAFEHSRFRLSCPGCVTFPMTSRNTIDALESEVEGGEVKVPNPMSLWNYDVSE
eukprot:284830-Pyramimonas_sp.AAC.4